MFLDWVGQSLTNGEGKHFYGSSCWSFGGFVDFAHVDDEEFTWGQPTWKCKSRRMFFGSWVIPTKNRWCVMQRWFRVGKLKSLETISCSLDEFAGERKSLKIADNLFVSDWKFKVFLRRKRNWDGKSFNKNIFSSKSLQLIKWSLNVNILID